MPLLYYHYLLAASLPHLSGWFSEFQGFEQTPIHWFEWQHRPESSPSVPYLLAPSSLPVAKQKRICQVSVEVYFTVQKMCHSLKMRPKNYSASRFLHFFEQTRLNLRKMRSFYWISLLLLHSVLQNQIESINPAMSSSSMPVTKSISQMSKLLNHFA